MMGPDVHRPRRWPDFLLVAQAMIVIVLLAWAVSTVLAIQHQQDAVAARQRIALLCSAHDIVESNKQVARKLGLPVDDIHVPNVKGLPCDELLQEPLSESVSLSSP